MTNFERLKILGSLDEYDMAQEIADLTSCDSCRFFGECNSRRMKHCIEVWQDWLNEEVEE